MKNTISTLLTIRAVLILAALSASSLPAFGEETIKPLTRSHIEALLVEKSARNPAQQKMDSQLIHAAQKARGRAFVPLVPKLQLDLAEDAGHRTVVDIQATVSAELLAAIKAAGGVVESQFPGERAIRALLPVTSIEGLAGRADVQFIQPAVEAVTNLGTVTTEGDRTHRADTARSNYANWHADGTGVKVGVISDGVNSLQTSQNNGNLNPVTVLDGEAGAGDEGTAMLEIVQDLAPAASLYFATGFGSPAAMATNIRALATAGCRVIVDDLIYFNESPFQDGPVAKAVNDVSAAGVLYFSAAGNYGSKLKNTSSTWEGDFADGGATPFESKAGSVHTFGGGVTQNTVATTDPVRANLFWADPLGASSNDYDLFIVNADGEVVRDSTNSQTGFQDPYETVKPVNPGERVVILKTTAAAGRFLHLDVGYGTLSESTTGSTRGHNASGAANAFSVAATSVANSPSPLSFTGGTANPVESFSSDGPRRMFFTAAGAAITPGNFSSNGGTVLQKPDITAANGVTTSLSPGTWQNKKFSGTSAAAPHAAAIAAMLLSYNPALTPAQVRAAMTSSALDIEGVGTDNNSGQGIVMALGALQAAPVPVPEIRVEQPTGTPVAGGLVSFGNVSRSGSASRTFTVKNTGAQPLIVSSISVFGANAGEFAVNLAGTLTTVPPLIGQTTFSVAFTPGDYGQRETTLRILSNDANPQDAIYNIALTANVLPPPPPTITSFTPTGGSIGSYVTINGTGFDTLPTVSFNGTTALLANLTSTSVSAYVPEGATTGPITVTTLGGTATSSTNFIVNSGSSGFWSTRAWTGDSTTGIPATNSDTNGHLVVALRFGSSTNTTVNGRLVEGILGGQTSSYVRTTPSSWVTYPNASNNLTAPGGAGSAVMASSFVYGNDASSIILQSLDPGERYRVSFFSVAFEEPGTRQVNFSSGTDQLVVDQDQFGLGNGIRVDYHFTASTPSQTINLSSLNPGGARTWHNYGIALVRVMPQPPTVTTLTASNVTVNSAVLNGTVNANGSTAGPSFYYGINLYENLIQTTPWPATGWTDTAVSRTVMGLRAHTNYQFQLIADNALGMSSGAAVNFTTANSVPVANNMTLTAAEDSNTEVILPVTDADGDYMTATLVTPPAHGTLWVYPFAQPQPFAIYTPAANYNGPDSFQYLVTDGFGGNSGARTVNITITAVDDLPTLDNISGATHINEDAGVQTVSLSGISAGAPNESQTLTVTATSNNPSLIPNPTVTYASPSSTGTLSYTSVAQAYGEAVITVAVSDGVNVISQNFTVVVHPVNDAPSFTLPPGGTPAGEVWTVQAGGSLYWQSIASSADGTKLAAAVVGGQIYTSTNSGITWTAQASGSRTWWSIASSADGTKLAAAVSGGQIYTSTNSGMTWTAQASGSRFWKAITSSSDGTKLAAVEQSGTIYTSTDSGVTWTVQAVPETSGSRDWSSIASSDDGTKLAAVAKFQRIATSTNSGITWTERASAGQRPWTSIASSSNGTRLVAVAYGGQIYTSTDSGVNWTGQSSGTRNWTSIASSSDGTKLAAVVEGGQIYTSADSGVTWTARASGNRDWAAIASSADGTKLAAGVAFGQIYTSTSGPYGLSVASDSGANTISNFATNISPGPADEAGQTVNFNLSNTNNALFAVQPAIASNGTLTFTPSGTGNGTATVTVTAQDNGGVAFGGVNTSAPQTFTITVNPDLNTGVAVTYTSATHVPITAASYTAAGKTVNFSLSYAPVTGTNLMVVKNTGLGFISGAFGNLAQGQAVALSFGSMTYNFVANYYGGTGNDLVLQWAGTRVFGWGNNNYGQLGINSTVKSSVPVAVSTSGVLYGKTVIAVSTSGFYSLALCSDGTVAAWGYNEVGQLGNNSTTNSKVPVAVNTSGVLAGRTVIAVAAGWNHSLVLCSDGTVAAWGTNGLGQLGNNSTTDSNVPVAVNTSGVLAGKSVIAIAAGENHSLALCSDGTVAAWGFNNYGQLGNNSTTDSKVPMAVTTGGALGGKTVIAIAAGYSHSLALCSDGTLAAWGYNALGQGANNGMFQNIVPEVVTGGALAGKTVTAIAAGYYHSLALCSDGTLAAWGYNSSGQLGNNSTTQSYVPVAVISTGMLAGKTITAVAAGASHSMALCSDGMVAAWGSNGLGQLGNNSSTNSPVPVLVSTAPLAIGDRFVAETSGLGSHSLALVASAPALAPTVTGISPAIGSSAGGTSVTITGTDFTGATVVTLGGTAVTGINVVNATTITSTTPAHAVGAASVLVTTPGGTNAANTLFTYADPATVTAPLSTNFTTAGATLGGTVTSDGGSAITERGVVYALTSVNADPQIGGTEITKLTASGTTGIFTVDASGLSSGSAYTFKAYATNAIGTSYTNIATFTTLALPIATTGAADSITTTGATLVGTMNPGGASTVATFHYGPTISYGQTATAAQSPVTGATTTAVSAAVVGLQPHTLYHFRVSGTNSAGTVDGLDATFTTQNSIPLALTQNGFAANEDTAQAITLAGTDADGDPLSFAVAAPPVHGTLSISGTIATYTPATNYNGSDSFTFTASDAFGGTSTEGMVSLTVNAVNDVPSFTKGANQSLPALTNTPQSIPSWAIAINDGDGEVIQALAFNVSVDNGALFSMPPSISNAGTLTYTPNGTAGTALVSVSLTDDATAGGPALTSIVQTFTITVAASSEIAVTGNNVNIVNGDGIPSLADFTDVGSVGTTDGTVVRTYAINNSGAGVLTLGIVTVGGTNAADFSVTAQPASSVSSTSSTTFQITFDPSAAGLRTATLSFATNDPDENPFQFSIQGTGYSSVVDAAAANYAESFGLSGAAAAPAAVPFNDGVSNLLKYAFNMAASGPNVRSLTPGTGNSGLPVITTPSSGGPEDSIGVEFVRRRNSGLIYAPLYSMSDLDSFAPMTAAPVVTIIDANWERVVIVQPLPTPRPTRLFSHVTVTAP